VALRSPEDPDITPPQTTIRKGPGAKLAMGKARFSFASSEAPSRFACKLDGHRAGGCKIAARLPAPEARPPRLQGLGD